MFELLIGPHCLHEALLQRPASCVTIYADEQAVYKEFKNRYKQLDEKKLILLSSHDFQEKAKELYKRLEFDYQRITGSIFAVFDAKEHQGIESFNPSADEVIVALDGVTDVNNIGAILRTCAFYGVRHLLISRKPHEPIPPSVIRHSSGGYELVNLWQTPQLAKTLRQLKEEKFGFTLLGLSDKSTMNFAEITAEPKKLCIIMGAEDKGLSHVVQRELDATVKLSGANAFNILNVSVATAITLEKIFTNKIDKK